MSSPSHIELPSVGTAGASAAAVALPSVPSPAVTAAPTTETTPRSTSRRGSKPTKRARKHVMMPTSARSGKRDKATREERPATTSARAERTQSQGNVLQGNVLQRIIAGLTASPTRMRILLVAVVAVVAIISIYPSVRDYYVASRDREVLSVRYAELSETNEELMHDISYLQSIEGIEDEARRRGYVLPGETSVSVEGLDGVAATEEEDATDIPWYQVVLDAIFGYEQQEW